MDKLLVLDKNIFGKAEEYKIIKFLVFVKY